MAKILSNNTNILHSGPHMQAIIEEVEKEQAEQDRQAYIRWKKFMKTILTNNSVSELPQPGANPPVSHQANFATRYSE